ncbi:hypothetical protein PV325_013491, partial [Microctonus aethiopoides]
KSASENTTKKRRKHRPKCEMKQDTNGHFDPTRKRQAYVTSNMLNKDDEQTMTTTTKTEFFDRENQQFSTLTQYIFHNTERRKKIKSVLLYNLDTSFRLRPLFFR